MAVKKAATKTSALPRKKVLEQSISSDLAGLGKDVVKIVDTETGENICYIGYQDEREKIYFPKPLCLEQIVAVIDFATKKKFNRALSKGNLDKAQRFADKKFNK